MTGPKFKLGDEVVDVQSGWRGRIDHVDAKGIARSYDVWFPKFAVGGVRFERQLMLVSAVDRLAEVIDGP